MYDGIHKYMRYSLENLTFSQTTFKESLVYNRREPIELPLKTDQTERICRLISVFDGPTCKLVTFAGHQPNVFYAALIT